MHYIHTKGGEKKLEEVGIENEDSPNKRMPSKGCQGHVKGSFNKSRVFFQHLKTQGRIQQDPRPISLKEIQQASSAFPTSQTLKKYSTKGWASIIKIGRDILLLREQVNHLLESKELYRFNESSHL